MKRLTFEEFQVRLREVDNARKIFNNLTDAQIEKSFAAYQDILASESMEHTISSKMANRAPEILDDYLRKKCPECGVDMSLLADTKDESGKQWPTAWHCSACFLLIYNNESFADIMREAQRDSRWTKE